MEREYLQEDLCECGHCYANHNIEKNYCWVENCDCKKFKPKRLGDYDGRIYC